MCTCFTRWPPEREHDTMRVNQLFSVGTYHTDLRYGWNLVLFDTETSTGTIKPYGTTFCKYPPGLIESCTHTNFPQSPWEKAVYSIFCNFKMAAWWTFDTIEFHTCLTASIAYSIWCIRPCSKISWNLWKGLYLGVYLGQADQHAHHSFCFFHYNCCGNIPCKKTFWSQEITTLEIWTPRGLIFHQNKMWLAGTKNLITTKNVGKICTLWDNPIPKAHITLVLLNGSRCLCLPFCRTRGTSALRTRLPPTKLTNRLQPVRMIIVKSSIFVQVPHFL